MAAAGLQVLVHLISTRPGAACKASHNDRVLITLDLRLVLTTLQSEGSTVSSQTELA